MRAVVEVCSVITERIWSVVRVELAREGGLMVIREVEGSKLWCRI